MAADSKSSSQLHIAMFPWLAIGHMTPFLHLANKLAEKGHRITYLLPRKAQNQLQHLNLHPHLITFHSVTIPHVDGLPIGTETASEIPILLTHLLAIAMDLTRDQVREFIVAAKPNMILYDNAHWIPEISKPVSIKTICYNVVSAAAIAIALVPARKVSKDKPITEEEIALPPAGYPSSNVVLVGRDARNLMFISLPFGDGISFYERVMIAMKNCDAIAIRTCREIEGKFCDYIGGQYEKQVFLTGPVLPEPAKTLALDDMWVKWLGEFESGSVVFCAFGSQLILEKKQFQELVLGFELTGLPFLVAVKPPAGSSTIEEALPEGFEERVKGRGIVWGSWVQQPLILVHPSVGCFVNHCGFGSMWESLMSDCQIVLVPHLGDQMLNTKLLADELKVAVEVKKDENGWVSKENLCRAIKCVMKKDSEEGDLVRKNHVKWKETLSSSGLMSGYTDNFVQNIQDLV